MILLLLLLQVQTEKLSPAYAKMKVGTPVTLTEPNQILETITYNGITVEAAYTSGPYSGSDPVYSCAAFIKKFYSMIYDIGVYNLNSKDSIPLVYKNEGSFSLTDQPRMGDIVRDNTRTHWAIVKSVEGDIITVVQQNYRSGNMAWINCIIDRYDPGYSYFTYNNRVENNNTETGSITNGDNNAAAQGYVGSIPESIPSQSKASEVPSNSTAPDNTSEVPGNSITPVNTSEVPGNSTALNITSEVSEGTYRFFQTSNSMLLSAGKEADGWRAMLENYQDSSSQMLSIVSVGEAEYAMCFISDHRFLAISDKNEIITTEKQEQNFVFVIRDNGYYTISPASMKNKIIAVRQGITQKDQTYLELRDYTGNMSEFWSFGLVSSSVSVLEPETTVNQKTLYAGYRDFTIGITGLKKNASVIYTSDQPMVAEVSEAGVVRAKGVGTATIHIQVLQDAVTYELWMDITVKEPSIKIASPGRKVTVGQSIGLKAKKYGTESTVNWQVSDQNIAVIDRNQTLIAKKRGIVTVTATTKEGLTAKIKLTII